MSYSVCRSGGKMCDGCMECYDRKKKHEEDYFEVVDFDEENEEEEEL